jgi:ubiquinone/menaquinone biosynthesis C-methylase UbiE
MHRSANSLTVPHALQPLWDRQLDSLCADALRLALELQLFPQLTTLTTPEHIADALHLHLPTTAYFLELLWSMDLLERSTDGTVQYRNLPVATHYLDKHSPTSCGDAILFRHTVLRQAGMQLDAFIRTGQSDTPPPDPAVMRRNWATAARVQIAQEQRAVTTHLANTLLSHHPAFAKATRLLDAGGGPGLVAIALAQVHPTLTGCVFEHSEAADVAQDMIVQANLQHRLHATGGDIETDDIGNNYDIIWCSSVLHFVKDIPAVLRKLYDATAPGGLLVCCHAEIKADAEQAARILPYYLHMRIQGRHVLPEGMLASLLQQAGFEVSEQHHNVAFPVAPLTVLMATKPQKAFL